jgi:membrane fusion protein (multidrug efflux system)
MQRLWPVAAVFSLAVVLTGCGKGQPAVQQMPPPEVGVVIAKAEGVALTQDLVGRLSPLRSADVRARVAGILQKRVYTEGSNVREGEILFRIDPAPLRATLDAQLANLAAAQATYQNAHIAAERSRSVADRGLLSRADLDNAEAAERTAAAAIKQAEANAESARINLGYANVVAPIAGRAGKQQVTEGALVGQDEATLLTTIEQIDPLYVNFALPVDVLDAVRRAAARGEVALTDRNKAKLKLRLSDGTPYDKPGVVDFSDTAVDAATGAVTLRGIVPNPKHALLPGMFVTLSLELGEIKHAWLVPQAAVQRDYGGAYVMVVGADNKAVQKRIVTDRLSGADWIVTSGLEDGDQIIVSGLQKAAPGAAVKAAVLPPAGSEPAGAAPATR